MTEKYNPPFEMTDKIAYCVIEIGELVGKIYSHETLSLSPKLRRENRIKSIHSSLAIENNTLSLGQATAVIAGKRVLAPPQDIREVQNAYEAYEHAQKLNPYSLDDLLKAHRLMMDGLAKDAGRFRDGNVGVYAGEVLIHAGSPANYVPELMQGLFAWLAESKLHPLIKSCVFHFEFEFIHPFSDGNGRTGRLWQTLLLSEWKPFFAWVPIETMIREHQQEYYDAIAKSDNEGKSTAFVEFMLEMIRKTLEEIAETESKLADGNVREEMFTYTAKQSGVDKYQLQRYKKLQAEGIARAKENGVIFGRPKVEVPENWDAVIADWRAGKITAVEAMKQTGIKKSTFYSMVKEARK